MKMQALLRYVVLAGLLGTSAFAWLRFADTKEVGPWKLVYELPDTSGFRPMAYIFINDVEEMRRNLECSSEEYARLADEMNFEDHTYLIAYGAEVESLRTGDVLAFFEDTSDSHCSARSTGKTFVSVRYKKIVKPFLYVYQLEKDESLQGFTGG